MNALELVKGVDFELVADNIRCLADRDGARVFEVVMFGARYNVLAHDAGSAEQTANNRHREAHPHYCYDKDGQ